MDRFAALLVTDLDVLAGAHDLLHEHLHPQLPHAAHVAAPRVEVPAVAARRHLRHLSPPPRLRGYNLPQQIRDEHCDHVTCC